MNAEYRALIKQLAIDRAFLRAQKSLTYEEQDEDKKKYVKKRVAQNQRELELIQLRKINSEYEELICQLRADREFVREFRTQKCLSAKEQDKLSYVKERIREYEQEFVKLRKNSGDEIFI